MFIENLNIQGLTDKEKFNYDSLEGSEPCSLDLNIKTNKGYKDIYEIIIEEKDNQVDYMEMGGRNLITVYGELNIKLLMVLDDNSAEIITYKKLYSFSYIKAKKKPFKIAWVDLKLSFLDSNNLKLFLIGIAMFSANIILDKEDEKLLLRNREDKITNIYLSEEFF